ncbi:MAG: Rrf2 family transcriptional regulator [Rhodospirillales bacterium]|nr:Rrf2 family transcriptional regulator [Rhodospirillales bacterium]
MRLTAYTDYTLRVLMYLALHPGRCATVAEIATAYGISAAHLNKVVQRLALAGEVETLRGRHGGIRLAKPPEAINLAPVVRRTEPDMDFVPCFAEPSACVLGRCCLLQGALRRAGEAFLEELGRSTLADLIGPGGPTADLFRARPSGPLPRPRRGATEPQASGVAPAPLR